MQIGTMATIAQTLGALAAVDSGQPLRLPLSLFSHEVRSALLTRFSYLLHVEAATQEGVTATFTSPAMARAELTEVLDSLLSLALNPSGPEQGG
jgi:hypothetical protein